MPYREGILWKGHRLRDSGKRVLEPALEHCANHSDNGVVKHNVVSALKTVSVCMWANNRHMHERGWYRRVDRSLWGSVYPAFFIGRLRYCLVYMAAVTAVS